MEPFRLAESPVENLILLLCPYFPTTQDGAIHSYLYMYRDDSIR